MLSQVFFIFQLAYANCARVNTLAQANTRRPASERAEPHFAPARCLPICKNFAHTSDLSCARPKSRNTRAPLGRPFGYRPHMRLICAQKHPLGYPAGNKKFFLICWVILLKFIKKFVIILKKHNFTERMIKNRSGHLTSIKIFGIIIIMENIVFSLSKRYRQLYLKHKLILNATLTSRYFPHELKFSWLNDMPHLIF